ncbi:ABC transporter substrate-binding protein [Bradyrhizobium diazoefficiens]|uniref:ABC transporter substrate-binding protein n=1 Tax=Bradyrhizobium diazoefficiens TaxID=1355477 RepID=UPI00190DBA2A|nr:ABC transporter substrate-binding protein [Bradyrhizobium diazoefficiens]MBK3664510.1 ABC transporter substrate-binding protein [Bradyrhizobium diazoefficiens]
MKRRDFIVSLGWVVALPLAVQAQQGIQVRRIAMLISGAQDDAVPRQNIAAFKQELQKLRWVDGENVRFETRFVSDDSARIRTYAEELVGQAPDVIVTSSNLITSIMAQQTRTVPIVFASAGDPVRTGLVTNMAHPGGNITGFTASETAMSGKLLELLKEAAPRLTRVCIIYTPGGRAALEVQQFVEAAAPSLGITIFAIPGRDPDEIERGVGDFAREPNGGLFVTFGPATVRNRKQIIALAAQYRLPAIYPVQYFVADGGLMSYAASQLDGFRRAAAYVDRILRGEKPGDLPVQAPVKYELVVNLKTATALGLSIPPTLLARADEVIE